MSVESLLARLLHVKKTAPRRWLAKCPAHDDRCPSLSVRELEDGRVLINDFGGCGAAEVLAAIGLEMGALFPERVKFVEHRTRCAPPIPAMDVLLALQNEAHVVLCAAEELSDGRALGPPDKETLSLAVQRIAFALEACRG